MKRSSKRLDREVLEHLPGVGPSIASDLRRLGVVTPSGLMQRTPEELFEQLEELDGPTDRCVLYVFRCATYYVDTADGDIDRERLNWWSWKHGH